MINDILTLIELILKQLNFAEVGRSLMVLSHREDEVFLVVLRRML